MIFGIAARISPVKDMGTLVRAFAETVRAFPTVRLIIAGDGEQRQEIEALAKELCPPGTVCFAGWVDDTDSFYNAIDVNMLTSVSEGFPYALPEGARMHCATIASRVGGIPYLIDDEVNGLLFQPQDVDALAERMQRLASDGALRERLSRKLFEKTRDQFSLEATLRHQEEIYASVLRRTARRDRRRDGVLICGAYGKRNAGDDAILRSIVSQLRGIDPDLPIYALSRHTRETQLSFRIGSCHSFNIPRYRRIMRRTKLYISGGGTLIQNSTSVRSLLYYLSNISSAHAAGEHVMMYGCGVGPVNGRFSRALAARTINRCVDTITLRDQESADELRRMGVTRSDIHLTADPALLLRAPDPETVTAALYRYGIVPGQRSLNFMMPMYMGEESTYPAYIHVYDEKQPDPETGEMKKETWLRLCVLTDNIGAVELTCRVYQENQLDMRLFFSSTETANEFRAETDALRNSLKDSKLRLKELKIGAVGERRFM